MKILAWVRTELLKNGVGERRHRAKLSSNEWHEHMVDALSQQRLTRAFYSKIKIFEIQNARESKQTFKRKWKKMVHKSKMLPHMRLNKENVLDEEQAAIISSTRCVSSTCLVATRVRMRARFTMPSAEPMSLRHVSKAIQ